jgi:archaellum component FlaC
MPDAQDLPVSPAQALCVYAEPLVSGRRVVVVGDASHGLGERLIQLGARTVHFYHSSRNPAPTSTREVRGLVVREFPLGDFDVRDGAFDVAMIPDLGSADEHAGLLARMRRLVAKGGAALVGAANPAGRAGLSANGLRPLDYYELYDRVALQFSHVRMIAQVPFVGVALADLGLEGALPDVSVDTQLASDPEAPEWFFALASQEEIRLADYAIVQLPNVAVVASRAEADGHAERVSIALAQAQLRATLLETQLDDLRTKAQQHVAAVEKAPRIAELEMRFGEEAARRRDAEGALKDAETRAGEHYLRAERLANESRELASELQRQGDRASALEGALHGAEVALGALRARAVEAEERVQAREAQLESVLADLEGARQSAAEAEEELTRAESTDTRAEALAAEVSLLAEGHVADVAQLEEVLRDRARAVRELDHEVSRRERIIQELLAALEDAKSLPGAEVAEQAAARDTVLAKGESDARQRELEGRAALLTAANDELRAKLDALAMDIARREGATVESGWRISELEQQIVRLEGELGERTLKITPPEKPAAAPDPAQADRVVDLQTELDVLRQALAQEHEARVRAESGRPHDSPGTHDSVDSGRA